MKQTIHYAITILLLIGVVYSIYENNQLKSELEDVRRIALVNNSSDLDELETRVRDIEDDVGSMGDVLTETVSDVSSLDSDIDDLEFELEMIKNEINY